MNMQKFEAYNMQKETNVLAAQKANLVLDYVKKKCGQKI